MPPRVGVKWSSQGKGGDFPTADPPQGGGKILPDLDCGSKGHRSKIGRGIKSIPGLDPLTATYATSATENWEAKTVAGVS